MSGEDLTGCGMLLEGAGDLIRASASVEAKWREKNLAFALEMVTGVRDALVSRVSSGSPSDDVVSMIKRVHQLAAQIREAGGGQVDLTGLEV